MSIDTIRGTQLYIKVGNGLSPETFAAPCLINTKRGIQFASSSNKIVVPDCSNPDDPAWTEVIKDALNATISGAGTLDTTDVDDYDAWFRSPDTKNVQIWLGTKGHWAGAFALTGWQVNGDRNALADVSLTLESSGALDAYSPAS